MSKVMNFLPSCKQFLKQNEISKLASRCCSYEMKVPRAKYGGRHTVSLLPGDGIGPEMMYAVEEVFRTARVPVEFEKVQFSKDFNSDSHLRSAILSIKRNGVCLKGSLEKSRDVMSTSLNALLRAELELDTNILHCKTFRGVPSRHDLDIVIIRQNTEGEYSMLEHQPIKGLVENTKVITRTKSEELGHYAFQFAIRNGRKKVTCVHKANIMKMTDGLFLNTLRDVSEQYADQVQFNDMIVDNTAMQVALRPSQFDVIVTPNLYGLVLQNLVVGLAGGAGLYSGGNFGKEFAIFEPGTRNTGSDLAPNVGNPVAMLKASVDMLNYLQLPRHADLILNSICRTIEEDQVFSQDLGGDSSTQDIVQNIKSHIRANIDPSMSSYAA